MAKPLPSQPPEGTHRRVRLHPEDEALTLQAIKASREKPESLLTLQPGDLEHWAETGEWPESRS